MTTTRIYRSTDTSAPVLTGQVGSFKDLLKKVLYGDGLGVAYGVGPSQKTAAGWALAYESGNKIALRNALGAGGSGFYLRIDDTGGTAAGAKEAMMIGYLSMSDIDTGVNPTPTAAQMTNGAPVRKSETADATARPWVIVADELGFWMHIQSNPASASLDGIYGAGDLDSFVPGDAYRFYVLGRSLANSGSGASHFVVAASGFNVSTTTGCWVGRSYTQSGNPVSIAIATPGYRNDVIGATQGIANPGPGSGDIFWVPGVAVENACVRGRFRGIYAPLNNMTAVARYTAYPNPTGMAVGSSLIHLPASQGTIGAFAVETALAW